MSNRVKVTYFWVVNILAKVCQKTRDIFESSEANLILQVASESSESFLNNHWGAFHFLTL